MGGQGDRMSLRILIVDDNAQIRRSLRRCIEREPDWDVCGEATDGQAAVEKVKELHPDAVVLDWHMPIMSGIEAARQIGKISPKTAMVMLTLHSGAYLSQEAKAAGIQEVISKTDVLLVGLFSWLKKVWRGKRNEVEQAARI